MDNDEYECMATPKPLLLRRHIFCEAIKINILKGSTVGIVHARLLPFVETKFGDFLFSLESYSHFIWQIALGPKQSRRQQNKNKLS